MWPVPLGACPECRDRLPTGLHKGCSIRQE
jgi:hypothetical protein